MYKNYCLVVKNMYDIIGAYNYIEVEIFSSRKKAEDHIQYITSSYYRREFNYSTEYYYIVKNKDGFYSLPITDEHKKEAIESIPYLIGYIQGEKEIRNKESKIEYLKSFL